MRHWTLVVPLVVFLGLILFVVLIPPSPTSAGMLPCFVCHGLQFQGSDIAPRVAGTSLTDDQILQQIRSPRGVMPAFPEFAQPFIIDMIRAMPTGQPTAALLDEQRSEALATIAAVAITRATEYARVGPQKSAATPTPSSIHITPTRLTTFSGGAASPPSSPSTNPTSTRNSSTSRNIFTAASGLIAVVGVWWVWHRKRSIG